MYHPEGYAHARVDAGSAIELQRHLRSAHPGQLSRAHRVEELLQAPLSSLDARLRAREGEAEAARHLGLREAFELREQERVAIGVRESVGAGGDERVELLAYQVIVIDFARRRGEERLEIADVHRSLVLGDVDARDLVEPLADALSRAKARQLLSHLSEGLLRYALSRRGILHSPSNECA